MSRWIAVGICVLGSWSVYAGAPAQYQLNVPAQSVYDALKAFATQTSLQVVYYSEVAQGAASPGVSGELGAEEALERILQGTGLTFQFLNERTVAIRGLRGSIANEAVTSERLTHDPGKLLARTGRYSPESAVSTAAEQTSPPSKTQEQQNKIQEIVVTAQKRQERLQDVPISMSVLRGDDLDRSTALGLTEELRHVPGVSIGQFGLFTGEGTIAVRGVAAQIPQDTGASPTGYYLDGVPFGFIRSAFVPNPNVYDLDQVEVLRGPQGTLYGASSLNGVVRVLTKDPDLDEVEFKARALTSNTSDGEWNYRGDMAVNMPIVKGKLAARAVAGYQDYSGWIDRPNKKDANDSELRNLRFKVNAQPTEELSLGFSAWLSRSDSGGLALADDDGNSASLVDEPVSADMDAFGLKVGYDFPWFSLASTTSNLDYLNSSVLDLRAGGASFELLRNNDVLAQEVLLTSIDGGSWRWSAGGIYRDASEQTVAFIHGLGLPGHLSYKFTSKSYAVFGELTRLFLDGRLELTAGARHFEDDQVMRELARLEQAGVPAQPLHSDAKFSSNTPRLILSWHPNKQTTVYASYSEGFRSGVEQAPNVRLAAPLFPSAEPDQLTNYEVGAKGSLLGGRVEFETALYYVDWQDVQSTVFAPDARGANLAVMINGESASGIGIDFGVTARPVDRLELGVNFSWNDLTVDDDVFSGGFLLMNKGDRLDYSAENTVGVSADYIFPVGRNGLEARFSASANYTSEVVTRSLSLAQGVTFVSTSDRISTVGTSLSIRGTDRWTAALFADNITNERGVPSYRSPTIPDRATRLLPRVIGVQLDYRF